ncbi:RNA polymerase, sigma-24 subunit, ECF subfamily [Methyloglobulus morosus KoM1]|uniref:RNA polymerase, sigma-24 subunit, ECF subfamily n=1 Tax=Methyloglobulus morosus KoM1 TaxID=1116472 RepID=V5DH35_9GAMM|nr:sigma-70 family RNA polymerase sigma factor [Methyloglobulus morosus]ESS66731.1 RNA polymerase, sigma-24 subunit, ECF subfamily [Methyloglobulus morosus KoM1]
MTYELSTPDQWLELYGDALYRYAITRVRDPDLAADLLQDTLLAALKAKDNFMGQASEQTWLTGILKHKMIDFFRKSSREKTDTMGDEVADYKNDSFFDEKGSWRVDLSVWSKPDKALEQEEFLAVLQRCVDKLPQKMSQVFILRELDGMESEEICDVMAISSLNNFWVMLSRARVQLRHCLDMNWFNQ